jgi:hypothetical protein
MGEDLHRLVVPVTMVNLIPPLPTALEGGCPRAPTWQRNHVADDPARNSSSHDGSEGFQRQITRQLGQSHTTESVEPLIAGTVQ